MYSRSKKTNFHFDAKRKIISGSRNTGCGVMVVSRADPTTVEARAGGLPFYVTDTHQYSITMVPHYHTLQYGGGGRDQTRKPRVNPILYSNNFFINGLKI